jgi:anaerobic ribonucleoside-triphosphate reductase activating protein
MSLGNGPGRRAVLWLQGCSLNCPGCFNQETHDVSGGELLYVDDLFLKITEAQARDQIDGLTVSGGEPLQQAELLVALLELIRTKTNLSSVIFTGFSFEEVVSMPVFERLKNCVDVLICGRYIEDLRVGSGLTGSANKTFHHFSERITQADFEAVGVAEVIIDEKGDLVFTGIDPVRLG